MIQSTRVKYICKYNTAKDKDSLGIDVAGDGSAVHDLLLDVPGDDDDDVNDNNY